MADIFLAYSRANASKAGQVQACLEGAGFSVFVDTSTPPGENWRRHVEAQLASCALLMVLWSKTSVNSDYVIEEADVGKSQGKLFPVTITPCELPYGFRNYQAYNLVGWSRDCAKPKMAKLLGLVRDRLRG